MSRPNPTNKKRREAYIGNIMAVGDTIRIQLTEALRALFKTLPEYPAKYPALADPILSVKFPNVGNGIFAFVEFADEVLASTAMCFNGLEFQGRALKIGRPAGYECGPSGQPAPLDVEPLRALRLLPLHPTSSQRQLCELYFGNLPPGSVSEATLRELLEPVCMELSEYRPEIGAPITKVMFGDSNCTYAFVLFQNAEMATKLLPIFNDMVLFGWKIKVGRPTYLQRAEQHLVACGPAPQPQDSEVAAAAVAAAASLTLTDGIL